MSKPTNELWQERSLVVIMCMVVVALKLPVLQAPYYWDEMAAYVEPSHWLSLQNLVHSLPGLHPANTFFGHPPALYVLAALAFKQFGPASSGPHVLALGFALLGICYTYRLGRLLYDRQIGLAAAILLFTMPLYFAQAGMFLGDIPVAALGVATVYYLLLPSYPAYLLAGLCLVLVKETGMAVIVAAVTYHMLTGRAQEAKLRRVLLLAVPLVALAIFFGFQKAYTGSLLPNPYFGANAFANFAPTSLLFKGGFTVYTIFFSQFRFLLTFAVIAGLIRCRREVFRRELVLFGLIALAFVGAFSAIYFTPRYCLPVLPYLAISGAAALFGICRSKRAAWGATAVCLSLFVLAMHGNSLLTTLFNGKSTRGINFETNMDYLNVIWTHKQAGEYLERHFPDIPVYAPWPLSLAYTATYLGYLSRPLQIEPSPEKAQVAVFTEQSSESELRPLERLIVHERLRPVQVFEKKGITTAIYLLPAASTPAPGLAGGN